MKRNFYLLIILMFTCNNLKAAHYNIITAGFTYSPATTNAIVGDTVTISASNTHPAVEVSQATWNANGNTPLVGGFGSHNTTFDIVLTTPGTIYFVCSNHSGSGMKGRINVTVTGVSELSVSSDIKFIANPISNGQFQVTNKVGMKGELYIFNILGSLQYSTLLNGEATQEIEVNLPSGNYLCRFIMEGNYIRTEKLIISGNPH